MRKYQNQIDDEIIKLKFTPTELAQYKELTRQVTELQSLIYDVESEASNRLKGITIGKLQGIKFKYLEYGDTFYMTYVNNEPNRKWYQFWK